MVGLAEAVAEARAAGLDVQAEGGRLIIRGARRHPDLAQGLLVRKAEVLALLAAEDAEVAWRAATMRPQIPPHGPVPFLTAGDVPIEPRCCQSCGNVLAP